MKISFSVILLFASLVLFGQNRFKMYPESDTLFFLTVVKAEITFQGKKGTIESLTLHQGGRKMLGKKVE